MPTAAAALSMKLLIDRKAQRVLFAEASKEVVDFLFSLLALPVATAVELIGEEGMVGCVGNLYASVDKLDSTYVLAGAAKDAFLRPTVVSPATTINSSLQRLPEPSSGQPKTFYRCNKSGRRCYKSVDCSCYNYVTDASGTYCMCCFYLMETVMWYVPPGYGCSGNKAENASTGGAEGFVQGIVYTVMDNLTVRPISATSIITLLSTFAVRDVSDLEERTVQLGYNEVSHWIFHLLTIILRF
ncbi:uncharacterized protein LOC133930596 [Phragmites australis]|uniref:uncharacterized protein LOC133930596 n=1 Tax=Phragmites australis TaxID=29695 RepID=UPI002D7A2559|nr:uncharacterized protein LOC133930596 [Phragmites australis]